MSSGKSRRRRASAKGDGSCPAGPSIWLKVMLWVTAAMIVLAFFAAELQWILVDATPVEAYGRIEANGTSAPIVVRSERPDTARRVVGEGRDESTAERDASGSVQIPSGDFRGLPGEYEKLVLASFEFDGLLVEWPDKGHEVDMLGMRKFDDVLAWQLELIQDGGRRWHLYLDSHTGDLVRSGSEVLLARESFDRSIVDVEPFDLENNAVMH